MARKRKQITSPTQLPPSLSCARIDDSDMISPWDIYFRKDDSVTACYSQWRNRFSQLLPYIHSACFGESQSV
jgi:hypothetical protein